MSKTPIVVIGLGEMGSVFARGFLRCGYPVHPVLRDTDIEALAAEIPHPELVLLAVGEKDLAASLDAFPAQWNDRIALLQNELLPGDYAAFPAATVISVWFEKKKGQDSRVLIPSPAFGPKATLLIDALNGLDISAREVDTADQMLFELVVKNLYILTTNIAGLKTGGTVSQLWSEHETFARDVATDVIRLQQAMTGRQFDQEALIAAMLEAFDGDPDHNCMGRSAPARLARALEHAERLAVDVPTLQQIAADTTS